jgi:hypothetical protein
MEINRNQYFLVGMVILLLGIQFRVVDKFVLSQPVTLFLAEKTGKASPATVKAVEATSSWFPTTNKAEPPQLVKKEIRPPRWLAWALMSIGGVLVLHSLAMRKPGG